MTSYGEFFLNRRGGNGGGFYEYVTDPDEPQGYAPTISHHRLIAWAHGELSELYEELEVDHVYHGRTLWPLLNFEAGLEAIEPSEHYDRTHARRARRRHRATERAHGELTT